MLNNWLKGALEASGLTQAELARRISDTLGRSIDRGAVHGMVSGDRRINADELIEIARVCNYPMPINLRGETSEMSRALLAINRSIDRADVELFRHRPPRDKDFIQIQIGDLQNRISSVLLRTKPSMSRKEASAIIHQIVSELQKEATSSLVHRIEPDRVPSLQVHVEKA